MIEVCCASCGEMLQADDACGGLTEFCPLCGALNDIPETSSDPEAREIPVDVAPSSDAPDEMADLPDLSTIPPDLAEPPRRSASVIVLWSAALIAVAAFAWYCVALFSDDWESDHLRALVDFSRHADALMANQDYKDAGQEYQLLLDTVGKRNLQSIYLKELVARAFQGHADAMAQERLAANSQPATVPATTLPALAGTVATTFNPILGFQRCSESFSDFLRNRAIVFQDAQGNWRRRQFVAWDVGYDLVPQSDPQQIQLHYICNSRKTDACFDRSTALADNDFPHEERVRPVHCQALFELRDGRWAVVSRKTDIDTNQSPSVEGGIAGADDPGVLNALAALEQQAFQNPPSSPLK